MLESSERREEKKEEKFFFFLFFFCLCLHKNYAYDQHWKKKKGNAVIPNPVLVTKEREYEIKQIVLRYTVLSVGMVTKHTLWWKNELGQNPNVCTENYWMKRTFWTARSNFVGKAAAA